MVLGVAGTSFAAANPFTDVPAKHWAYDSVMKLSQAGVVDGYGDGTYRGDKLISRYEMAQMVAKAMARSDKADAAQKAEINKLATEFAEELNVLGVRVTNLEKKVGSVKVSGNARLRFQDTTDREDGTAADKNLQFRTRIFLEGNINDEWKYAGRMENVSNLYSGGDTAAEKGVNLNNAYVTGPIAGVQATIGRMDVTPIYGYVMDDQLKGAKLSFGKGLKTNLYYGKIIDATTFTGIDLTLAAADVKYATSKATNLVGGFYQYKETNTDLVDGNHNIWEAGFDSKIANNLVFKGDYMKSNADEENKGYVVGLSYKGANAKKVGSFGTWVNYRDIESAVLLDSLTLLDNAQLGLTNDGKGYEIGASYTPMMNTVLGVKYVDTKTTGTGDEKAKFIRAQAEFFF
jgi:hypothetical protein